MELYLGINFENHDTAVFFMNPSDKDVFAISTERITRFKHEKVFPLPAIEKFLENTKTDPKSITRIVCGNPKVMQKSARYRLNFFEREMFLRQIIGEKYLKGHMAGLKAFNAKSPVSKYLYLFFKGMLRKYRNIEKSSETAFQIDILKTR